MENYPAGWEADVVLRDGGTAHLRPITPDDSAALARMHEAQSPESVYLRFFAPLPRLPQRDLDRFVNVDHRDRVALIMLIGDDIIGVGRFDRLNDTEAEVAFNIADAHQGRGVGSILLEHLAAAARESGIQRFTAEVLPRTVRCCRSSRPPATRSPADSTTASWPCSSTSIPRHGPSRRRPSGSTGPSPERAHRSSTPPRWR